MTRLRRTVRAGPRWGAWRMTAAADSAAASFDWNAYGLQVIAGIVPACKWTRLGVERHYRDMQTGHLRGLWFSEDHAQHALESFLSFGTAKASGPGPAV